MESKIKYEPQKPTRDITIDKGHGDIYKPAKKKKENKPKK